jgi:hypothetical protein
MSEGAKKAILADAAKHEKRLTSSIPTGEREQDNENDEDEPSVDAPEQLAAK